MKITLHNLKDTMKVAKFTGKPENFSCKISNDERDISIIVTYFPEKNIKEDMFPYWRIEMKEEEFFKNVILSDLKEIRNTYNCFCTQGNKSFLENYI